MTYAMKWTIAMTVFGLTVAMVVLLVTDSVGWALVGLLGAGMVGNAVLQPHQR